MALRDKGLRSRALAVVAPANALFIAVSCGGTVSSTPSTGAAGTGAAGAGTAGSETAGTAGAAGTGTVLGTAGTGGSAGSTGQAGGSGGGGSPSQGPHTWGEVTAQPRDCSSGSIGACCHYDFCFTREKAAELFPDFEGEAGAGAGGAGEAGVACPLKPQLAPCAFVEAQPSRDGMCCYDVYQGGCCGRPMVVAGELRMGELERRADWLEGSRWRPDAELPEDARAELAAAWAGDALMEHASVASFARFALELLNAGAPAELVEAAQRASLEEIVHARLCFELASGFGGSELGPSALSLRGVELDRSLEDLAVAVLLEGAIGETLAAALAGEQLAVAGDARCRAALRVIERDEAAHALLAWRFLRYAVDRGGAPVALRLRSAVSAAPRRLSEQNARVPSELWNHYGRLTDAQRRRVVASAWSQVIEPAVQLLCGASAAALAAG